MTKSSWTNLFRVYTLILIGFLFCTLYCRGGHTFFGQVVDPALAIVVGSIAFVLNLTSAAWGVNGGLGGQMIGPIWSGWGLGLLAFTMSGKTDGFFPTFGLTMLGLFCVTVAVSIVSTPVSGPSADELAASYRLATSKSDNERS